MNRLEFKAGITVARLKEISASDVEETWTRLPDWQAWESPEGAIITDEMLAELP